MFLFDVEPDPEPDPEPDGCGVLALGSIVTDDDCGMKCRLSKLEFELVVSKSGGGASRLV